MSDCLLGPHKESSVCWDSRVNVPENQNLRVPPGLNSLTPTIYGNPIITMFISDIDNQNHIYIWWCIIFLTSYTSDICMGLISNICFKGTPGFFKHYSGLPMANPGGPLKKINLLFTKHIEGYCCGILSHTDMFNT